jgi:Na+/proline symporter
METNQEKPEEVQQDQIAGYHDDIRQIQLEGYEFGVKKARNALFVAAAALLLGFFISLAQTQGQFIEYLLLLFGPLIVIFILLGLWTKKKPFTAIVVGLIVFVGFWVGFSILDPVNIFAGILVKIFVLAALIRPLKDAKELQQVLEEKKLC